MHVASNSEKTTIRAIIFDWAGVFCVPGEPFSHPSLAQQTHLTVDELSAATKEIQHQYYCGTISSDTFWQTIIQQFALKNVTPKELSSAYLASYQIYPGMLEFAQTLKNRFPTALVSNLTHEMMEDIINKHHADTNFNHTIFSNQVGTTKPDAEIFHIALQRLGTHASETLFIDDSTTNVEAAKALGFPSILFTSPTESKAKILSFLS
jgi:HAD superfamily hydrolase (TIGR01509 family)